jgi:hypothetical protein
LGPSAHAAAAPRQSAAADSIKKVSRMSSLSQ